MTESDRIKCLRVALLVVGLIFYIWHLVTHDCLAFWLGMARRRSLGIS